MLFIAVFIEDAITKWKKKQKAQKLMEVAFIVSALQYYAIHIVCDTMIIADLVKAMK